MNENSTSGTHNGESATHAKERLRAKASAAGEAVRERAEQARTWARSRLDGLQNRVETQPYKASAVALGVGFIAGIVLAGMIRGRRR